MAMATASRPLSASLCPDRRCRSLHAALRGPSRPESRPRCRIADPLTRSPASPAAAPRPEVSTAQSDSAANEDNFEAFVQDVQRSIIAEAEALEGKFGKGATFRHDRWDRDTRDAGFGITSVLEDGAVLEKGACNVTVVRGVLSAQRAQAMSSRGRSSIDPAGGQPYSAAAMSLVFHARSPLVPTLRADVRVFEVAGNRWFGGGCDLTPSYVYEDDCREFHRFWKELCDRHHPDLYPEYKEWCDRYFFIPARGEHRGVGGIFFDDLDATDPRGFDPQQFTKEVARGVVASWAPIVERRQREGYTDDQRQWQLLRRGRYLEFNLLYDRGVKFGLDGGRVESIMVSAPPLIAWRYRAEPEPGTPEHDCLEVLRKPRQWV